MYPTIFDTSSAAAALASSTSASFPSDMQSDSTATAFASGELDGVFRSGNDAHSQELNGDQVAENGMRRRRFNSSSFATDGELSTFSEEENDGSEIQENINSGGIHQSSFFGQSSRRNLFNSSHEQRSPLSIFRSPISGTKRRRHILAIDSEDMMADDDAPQDRVNITTPLLCRAKRICSDDESSDDESNSSNESLDHVMSTPSAKRCRSSNGSPSSYIALFSLVSPATLDYRGDDSAIITFNKLENPLAGRALIESSRAESVYW